MAEELTNFTRPYARLSRVYDLDWANFARRYPGLILPLLDGRGIEQARILDLACGTGGLAIELAGYGHTVHGLDSSPEMVALAMAKSRGMANVSFEVGDMAGFSTEDKYDLITCTFDSINYLLDAAKLQDVFRRVADALDGDGLFVFDANTPQIYINHNGESYQQELDGQTIVQRIVYAPDRREATTTFEFADGTVEAHRQRPYELAELELMLNAAGLYVAYAFGGFDKQPYTPDSERLICVAEKDDSEYGIDRL